MITNDMIIHVNVLSEYSHTSLGSYYKIDINKWTDGACSVCEHSADIPTFPWYIVGPADTIEYLLVEDIQCKVCEAITESMKEEMRRKIILLEKMKDV